MFFYVIFLFSSTIYMSDVIFWWNVVNFTLLSILLMRIMTCVKAIWCINIYGFLFQFSGKNVWQRPFWPHHTSYRFMVFVYTCYSFHWITSLINCVFYASITVKIISISLCFKILMVLLDVCNCIFNIIRI